jgi:formylglycine-generating enzyme required for sulfatase activity
MELRLFTYFVAVVFTITTAFASTDTDGDGANDYREIKDGTNPNNPSSFNPLSKGLVAYYPFDGNVNDESGNNNLATPLNISYGADQNSSANSAAQFLRGSAIDVPSLNSIPFKPITYGLWVKFNSILRNAQTTLIGRKQAWNQEDGAITIYDLEGFNKKLFYHTGGSGVNSDFTAETDLWYHVAFTQNSESFARFYVNGSLIKEVNFTAPQSSFFPFRIGAESALQGISTGEGVFDGALNDVRIYNRALSATEVQALYAREATVQFTSHPQSRTLSQDLPVTFSVSATGQGLLSYQWQKDGLDIPGATGSSFDIASAKPWHIGSYSVRVSDNNGPTTSEFATLALTGYDSRLWDGLVAYYPFEGNAEDLTPFGNNLVVLGNAVLSTDRFGDSENSYYLDGGGNAQTNTASSLRTETIGDSPARAILNVGQPQYTITGWFQSHDMTKPYQTFVNTIPHFGIAVGFDPNSGRHVTFGIGSSARYWDSLYDHGTKNNYANFEWHQFALVKNGVNFSLYVDGNMEVNKSIPAALNYNENKGLRLGGISDSPDGFLGAHLFFGRLDDYRIYNRALSGGEIGGLYASESSGLPVIENPSSLGIGSTSASCGGSVTAGGGAAITERGVVFSATATNPDPLIGGTGVIKLADPGTTGVFTVPVTGLTPATTYSYKAYATNGQGTTYTSVGTFTTLSTNADLSSLTLSGGTLDPTFDSGTTAYTASVANAVNAITVTPTRAQSNATIEARVNDSSYTAVTSGSASTSLALNVGANTVDLRVTAQDGTTQKTYTVTVTRDKAAQTITFANPGAQFANATVNLSATGGGSGNPVTFAVTVGPASITDGVLSFSGAGSVTVTASQAGNANYDAATNVSRTFTVTKAAATVTLGNLAQTYDGTPKTATVTTDPAGKSVLFTYDGSATAPTNAASYDIVGSIDDPIYQGSATGTLVIAKAAQTITFAAIPNQLITDTVALSATGGGSGNPVTFAVASGPGTISNGVLSFATSGEVTITASQAGNTNYENATPVSRTFTVTKATATVTLGNLSQTYDGTPKSATATTDPTGKTIVFTYDGGSTAPTNAGSYVVVGTINDPIHQGSATGTLQIAKATQTITFATIPDKLTTDTVTLSATGGGSGNPVTFAVAEGPATISSGALSFTGAGNVTVTASQAGNANYEAASTVSRTFAVTKANATVTLDNLAQIYDGTPKSATAATNPAGKSVVFTYEGSATAPTNAGSYEVVGTINDPIYQGNTSGTLEITKAAQAITFAAIPDKLTTDSVTLSATGGGSGNAVTFAVTEGPATISSGVISFTGAGNVTVTASQAGNANYEAAATVSRSFTVTKASATVTLENLSQTYDGTPRPVTASTNPSGKNVVLTYDDSSTPPTEAGFYAVIGTISDPIYQGSASRTLSIAKAAQAITFAAIPDKLTTDTVTLSATGGGSGNPVSFAVTNGPATIGGGVLSFTGAGSVTVTASQMGNANYDAATNVSRTFTVTKANATVTLGNLSQTYDGTPKSATATTDPAGKTVTFTYEGSATAPANAGSYEVVGTINDPIYQGSATGTLVIDKAAQAITFAAIPNQLATDTVALSATGGGSGNPVTFAVTSGPATITNGVLSFTTSGEVTITANQAGNTNYENATPVSHTFTVSKATATVTLGNLSQTYDGTPKTASATTDPAGKTVTFTYEGSSTAPNNAGSYAVVATIDDPIYQGSANGTLTIAKAAQTITFANPGPQLANATVTLSPSGGGSGNPVTFAVTSGLASINNGVLTFTGPGNVTITASQIGDANYESATPVSQSFTVSKAAATITLSRLHQVADGTAREIVVTTVPADLEIEVTYDGAANAPVAPGSYAVVATSADDRYEGSASGTLVVDDPARSLRVPGGSLSALGDLAVPTFSIGAYEVTGSQWATVVTWAEANAGYDFAGAGAAASGDRPVTGISWFDAAKWCNARTDWENALLARSLAPAYRVAGAVYKISAPASPASVTCDFGAGGYRLPTAAEWEYAARGGASGTPSTYPGGNTLDDLGWSVGNSNGATQPAGGKTANGLGLYDLAGNAAEWTWDAPTGSPGRRLLQGGAWSSAASACELSSFASETASARLDRSGFRVARSISLALAAALDAPGLAWESGGDEAWSAQTAPSHDGSDAAESGTVAPGQSSWLETTVTGPVNLRFRWEASQRAALDLFRLETRTGDPILLTGAANWSERLVELPAGDHTLRWLFVRDAASTGISRVRLDAVSVTPATTPTVTTAAAASISGSGATLGGNVTADGGRTVTARGVVYSTTPEPSLTSPGALAAASGGTGTFSVVPAGLDEGTTYFARAYATNHLGTAYGAEVVFTTHTTVPLTEGLGTVTDRPLLAGDTQRFRFGLAFPSDAAFTTTGLDAATWELRDSGGVVVDSGSGNVDFGGLLLSGQYLMTVTSTGGTTQTFSLDLDASTEAVPKPDLSIGSDPTAATGVGVYPPTAQSIAVLSRRGDPVTLFAKVANEGLLPDAMKLRGSGGNSLFAVSYTTAGANVTASVIVGTFATEVIGPDDAAVGMTIAVTPNKRLLTKKVKKGKRLLTTTLRKTHSGLIEATAAGDPTRSDTVRYQVTTTP